jgi:hypothetical protein
MPKQRKNASFSYVRESLIANEAHQGFFAYSGTVMESALNCTLCLRKGIQVIQNREQLSIHFRFSIKL